MLSSMFFVGMGGRYMTILPESNSVKRTNERWTKPKLDSAVHAVRFDAMRTFHPLSNSKANALGND